MFIVEEASVRRTVASSRFDLCSQFLQSALAAKAAFLVAAALTPAAAARLLAPLGQQHFIAHVEEIKQHGDFVGQLHAASEAGREGAGKPVNSARVSFISSVASG